MHPTLARQLRRLCGVENSDELAQRLSQLNSAVLPPEIATFVSGLEEFFTRINTTYEQNDRDLDLRSRSLEESSSELNVINDKMRGDIASRNRVLQSVRDAASKLLDQSEQIHSIPNADDLEGLSSLLPILIEQQENRRIESKRMAEKIIASERQYRALVESVRDVIFQMDEDGNWVFLNPVWEEITGFSIAESLQKNFIDFVHHDDLDKAADFFSQLSKEVAQHTKSELRFYHKSRHFCWFEFTIQCEVDLSMSKNYFTGTLNDITERRRISQLQSEFISVVSHELRTPLTSIRGSLGILESGKVGTLADAQLKLIQIAHKNSQRLVTLVNDILDMEKLMAEKMSLKFDIINLVAAVEHAIEANAAYAHTLDTHLTLCEHPTTANINADSNRLMQVMANLLSNAAKFSPKDRAVEISIIVSDQHKVKVNVRDHGPGIPLDFRSRIFSAFAQADSSDTRQQGGTGLGLKISKMLIDKMGGTMGFESELNVGTCFWFEFPLVEK